MEITFFHYVFTAEAQRAQSAGGGFFSFAFERPRWHGMQAKANEKFSLFALFAPLR
jgi:hypothetical protein